MSELSLKTMVAEINTLLASYGIEAIQETKMEKEGQLIGQIKYGFKPQYVFDAINEVIGPENWRYEAQKYELFEQQAVIETRLFIRLNGEWLLKGSQFGQMQVVKGNVGDALKGAITDSIQKAFSLLSVGKDAYSGKLKTLWAAEFAAKGAGQKPAPTKPRQQQKPKTAPQPSTQTPAPPSPAATGDQQPPASSGASVTLPTQHLPLIAGVDYVIQDDRYIATGERLFDKKELLKAAGFRWEGNNRQWSKDITQ